MRFANSVAKQLGVYGLGLGSDTPHPEGKGERRVRDIRLVVPQPVFPSDGLRVELGETIDNVTCRAVNDSEQGFNTQVKAYVLYQ